MIESLHIAATGMHAQQVNIDVIANNLANVNTTGFKKSQVNFEDLMYRQAVSPAGLLGHPDLRNPVGLGAGVSYVGKVFVDGELETTEAPLDLAINGDGFFELILPDGTYAYSRAGSFQVDRDGMLVNPDGYLLSDMIQLPFDTEEVLIKGDGTVSVQLAGQEGLSDVGRIELAGFVNPGGLTPVGDNLFIPSHGSGDAFHGEPGQDGLGLLLQGTLESSNVKLTEELVNLLVAQRSYEINSKVIKVSDELLGIVNDLRR
jgi:flagellar basal-body rod protein FlgG